jgi:hypothetical protein
MKSYSEYPSYYWEWESWELNLSALSATIIERIELSHSAVTFLPVWISGRFVLSREKSRQILKRVSRNSYLKKSKKIFGQCLHSSLGPLLHYIHLRPFIFRLLFKHPSNCLSELLLLLLNKLNWIELNYYHHFYLYVSNIIIVIFVIIKFCITVITLIPT